MQRVEVALEREHGIWITLFSGDALVITCLNGRLAWHEPRPAQLTMVGGGGSNTRARLPREVDLNGRSWRTATEVSATCGVQIRLSLGLGASGMEVEESSRI